METDAPVKAGEYHLHFWGGINNNGLATAKFGPERNFWFETARERKLFRAEVDMFAHATGRIVAFSENDGPMALKRTIAKMDLMYRGTAYPYEYDFGYGYPADGANYMFFEGNYACDCNLSMSILEKYPDANIQELDCGDEIEIKDFEVEYQD